jgi:primosomal replication protein N
MDLLPVVLTKPSQKNNNFKNFSRQVWWLMPVILAMGGGDQEDCSSRPGQEKSLQGFISINKSWVWWCTPVILTTWKTLIGGSQS